MYKPTEHDLLIMNFEIFWKGKQHDFDYFRWIQWTKTTIVYREKDNAFFIINNCFDSSYEKLQISFESRSEITLFILDNQIIW
jgi:hypothetical protein